MKPLTLKQKVARINKEICPRYPYEFDNEGRLFHRSCDGTIFYETERKFNSFYNAVFHRGYRAKNDFKRRVNRVNRRVEKTLTKDEDKAESIVGVVHRGDIWDIT